VPFWTALRWLVVESLSMLKKEISIAFCGDIMLGRHVPEHMGTESVTSWLRAVSSAWKDVDLLIGNLETPCVEQANPVDGPLPELVFQVPASRLTELKAAGFSALTLANNHILNCGPSGLRETIAGLKKEGIKFVGAGMNIREALEPSFITVRQQTIGLVAFCYGPEATESTPGVAPATKAYMRHGLKLARAKADVVVAILHDGLEYSDVPPARIREKFVYLAEHGADIVVGHHPHVLQGLEWVGKVPVAYSLGDFVFDNSLPDVTNRNLARMALGVVAPKEVRKDPQKFGRGAVLTVNISEKNKKVQWHPFRQSSDLRPQLSVGNDREEDLKRLEDLSQALLDPSDPRHALAEFAYNVAWAESRDTLSLRQILQMAARPKWRYVSEGFKWLGRRIKKPKLFNIQNV